DELAPRRDRRNRRARCPRHPPGRSSRLALVHAPPRAGQHHHHSAAAEVPRAQPGRERLAVHARQLALQPHLQILRRSRRPLLCGMEQARRSALAHHVHRTAPMGPRVLINGISYKPSSSTLMWRETSADGSSVVTKVLYIEDNDDNVYMLKMRLELLGDFEVLTAEDGEKGCEMAAAVRPDNIPFDLEYTVVQRRDA